MSKSRFEEMRAGALEQASERVHADRLGRHNPRMWFPEWTKWVCNSPACPAWALVPDRAIQDLLEEIEPHPQPDLRPL